MTTIIRCLAGGCAICHLTADTLALSCTDRPYWGGWSPSVFPGKGMSECHSGVRCALQSKSQRVRPGSAPAWGRNGTHRAPPKEDEHTVAQQLTLVHGPHQYGSERAVKQQKKPGATLEALLQVDCHWRPHAPRGAARGEQKKKKEKKRATMTCHWPNPLG